MRFVKNAKYLKDYLIFVEFSSGESGTVDLKEIVYKYAAANEIRDPKNFCDFFLDEWPTLAWKCGFDLSPETLYKLLTNHGPDWETCSAARMVAA